MKETKITKIDPIAALETRFSKQTYFIADEIEEEQLKVISTGSLQINKITGINGIPIGRITEVYGNESSGKTTLCLQTIAECQKNNGTVALIDMEGSFDLNYAKNLGIDTTKLIVAQPTTGEMAFDMIETLLKTNGVNLIVIDSVAAMIPETEYNSDMNEALMGVHARLMSKGLRKIQPLISRSNTAIIFINQIREKINTYFGNPENTTGGKALKFYASLRIEMRKADVIKEGVNKIGVKAKVSTIKNKLAPPLQSCHVDIFFGQGFDYHNEIIDFGIDYGFIKKAGSWYSYNNQKIGQGREQLKNQLLANETMFNEIKELVLKALENTKADNIEQTNNQQEEPLDN